MRKRRIFAAAAALPLAIAGTGIAHADIVQNNVVAGGNDTIVAGGSTTVTYRLQVEGTDGLGGCNATDGTPATVSLSVPADVTASSTSVVFTKCGGDGVQTVTFSSNKAGDYPITVSSIEDAGSSATVGTYTNTANFTLHVTSSNTKPSVVVTGAVNGGSYQIGSEPTPGCSVTDAEDGPSTHLASVTGTLSHKIGQLTATCGYTDNGGLQADTKSVTYSIVDTVNPTINGSVSPAANAAGWHNTDVDVTFTCADTNGSGIKSCVGDTKLSTEGVNQSVTGTATDWADNTATATVSRINIDKTDPVITSEGATTSPDGLNGWYTTKATVTFKASDNLSGFSGEANPYTFTKDTVGEGSAVTVASGTVNDVAGNTSNSVTGGPLKVDLVDPTVTCGVAQTFVLGSVGTVSATVIDTATGSGVADDEATVAADTSTIGPNTVVITGYDNAGRSGSNTCSYNVVYDWTGFFQPVDNNALNSVKAGSAIPVKFNLGGNQGLNILAAGSPSSKTITCDSTAQVDAVEQTVTAGASSLSYDSTAGHYTYVWKSDKAWAGTCRQLVVTLADGTAHRANFKFLK